MVVVMVIVVMVMVLVNGNVVHIVATAMVAI